MKAEPGRTSGRWRFGALHVVFIATMLGLVRGQRVALEASSHGLHQHRLGSGGPGFLVAANLVGQKKIVSIQ